MYYFSEMNKLLVSLIALLLVFVGHNVSAQDWTSYVNPMIGTGGVGHTYPGATVPFGMVQLSPDTRRDGSWEGCAGYYYPDSLIYGFSHTHLSGTGCSDYGDILTIPGNDKVDFNPDIYASSYSHASEVASPGYYAVTLADHAIRCELTATTHAGMQRYSYPKEINPTILLDLVHRDKVLASSLVMVNDHRIDGFRRSEAWARDQWIYFSMEFSQPIEKVVVEGNEKNLNVGDSINSNSIRVAVFFRKSKTNIILVRTGISTVSEANAHLNLVKENDAWDFEMMQSHARSAWNNELGKIAVSGGSKKSLTNFYTALYHTMIVPNVLSDVDGRYRGRDNKIHNADGYTQYSVFSLWDTFRAAHPLYALIDRKRTLDYIKTFLAQYEQGGRLPVWELMSNETDCMIGYHSVSVIADAMAKGITGFNVNEAFDAMKKSSNWNHLGLPMFNRNNFLQVDDESESVSKSLEYAYDDWCIAQVARSMNNASEAAIYDLRASSYINQYDPSSGFMRPRKNGSWFSPFDPREVNNHYTEANSYQYSFFVPQDIPGMIDLMGGVDATDKKLDGLFNAPNTTTGRSQADITGLIGQYAHGNEPSHHMAYLYNYIGRPWKTQALIHLIVDSLYQPVYNGLPGNEDCGQMSAWYVWSALGFYPVTPGSPYYALGTPLFDKAIIRLENGRSIEINARRKVPNDFYVSDWKIGGVSQKANILNHSAISNGAVIDFSLESNPVLSRGTASETIQRLDKWAFVQAPFISAPTRNFADSMLITISAASGLDIYYSLDEYSDAGPLNRYEKPFYISQSIKVNAFCKMVDRKSGIVTATYYRLAHPKWKVALLSNVTKQYSAEGPQSMIDGVFGSADWRKGDWHGYQSQNMIVDIAFDKEEIITSVRPGFLQDTRSWIVMPKNIKLQVSMDGITWIDASEKPTIVEANDYTVQVMRPEIKLNSVKAKFLRVTAENFGVLPSWHAGAGFDAFIFCDEIEVNTVK